MASRKQSSCAAILDNNLEELRRREDLESLRPYLVDEQCFMPHKDLITSP